MGNGRVHVKYVHIEGLNEDVHVKGLSEGFIEEIEWGLNNGLQYVHIILRLNDP